MAVHVKLLLLGSGDNGKSTKYGCYTRHNGRYNADAAPFCREPRILSRASGSSHIRGVVSDGGDAIFSGSDFTVTVGTFYSITNSCMPAPTPRRHLKFPQLFGFTGSPTTHATVFQDGWLSSASKTGSVDPQSDPSASPGPLSTFLHPDSRYLQFLSQDYFKSTFQQNLIAHILYVSRLVGSARTSSRSSLPPP
ncbi:hypothetical protein B0H19DRAFT_1065403 [Mycena capillaripes]|nr:hypothetical protein B0H19DRAFT_1065403 [Mycena capillaripes]